MPIRFTCPECKASFPVDDRCAGRTIRCPKCVGTHQVPAPPPGLPPLTPPDLPPTRQVPQSDRSPPALPRRRPPPLRYARPFSVNGSVVGLEKVREQYVQGRGYLSGSHTVTGYYSGPHPPWRAAGAISGYGAVYGEHAVWTEYQYETVFFVREPDGRDFPVRVVGEHLPLLDGHRVSVAVVANDWREYLLAAVVNHSTGVIHWTTTEGEVVRFLGIPQRRRVRVEVMTPAERDREIDERGDRLRRLGPVSLAGALAGGAAALLGCVLFLSGAAVGCLLVVLGVCLGLAGGLVWGIHYQRLHAARNRPLAETTSVRNPEVDAEIDALDRFVEGLLAG